MTATLLDRAADWQWGALAALAGLLIAVLPPATSALLIGLVLIGLLMLIEPALALVVMLCVAPLKTLIETEGGLTLPFGLDIGQFALIVAVGVWITRKAADREPLWRGRSVRVYGALLTFLAATALTLPGAVSPGKGLSEWLKWAEILLLAFMTADFAEGRWRWLLFGVLLAASIQALLGIYQFTGGSGAPHLWILDYRFFRAFGTFGQPNPFGALMGLSLPLALGTAWGYLCLAWQQRNDPSTRERTRRAVSLLIAGGYGGMAALILAGLLVSWSRGAWIGFAAALLTLLWLAPSSFKRGALAVAGAGGLFGLLWLAGLAPASITERIAGFTEDFAGFRDMRGVAINDDNFAVVERMAHWQAAIAMAERRPWLGVGFGNYEAAYPDFALINWPLALGHAHNYYLNLLAETGILGLVVYMMMGAVIIRLTYQALRQAPSPVEQGIALGLMGVWTHLAVHSLFDKLYVNNLFLTVGVLLGLLVILLHRAQPGRLFRESNH
jgi:O-antigen ligase